jgi:hypothetical protein
MRPLLHRVDDYTTMKLRGTVAVVLALVLVACGTSPPESPTPTVVPIATVSSAETPQTGGSSTCDPNVFLPQIKEDLPFAQVSLLHNFLLSVHYINLWVVLPDLEPEPVAGQTETNRSEAALLAAKLSHLIANGHPCVRASFERITTTIVDRRYHAWFVGDVGMTDIPAADALNSDQLAELSSLFVSPPSLETPVEHPGPAVPPTNACEWQHAREALRTQFSPAGPNVDFYFVIDQDGANVWAQWEGPDPQQTPEGFLSGLLSLQAELQCLNPPVDILWMIYTDGSGRVSLVMAADGEALRNPDPAYLVDHLQLIYPAPSS